MHNISKILILIIFYFFTQNSYAQNIPSIIKADAQNLISNGNVYGAIEKFEEYSILKPDDGKVLRTLGELFEVTRNYEKAATYFYRSYEADRKENIISLFDAARMLKMTGAYETALKDFITFKSCYKGKDSERNIKKLADTEIKGCLLADSLINNPLKIKINHLDTSINKVYSEFSPFPLNDSVFIYASLRQDQFIKADVNDISKQFYKAKKKNDHWIGGYNIDEPFNDKKDITGNGTYSSDRKRFYFTRCQHNVKNKLICSLYLSMKVNNNWSKPRKLKNDINLKKFNSSQPTIAIDQKNKNKEIIYFASDRPGGKGKYDIWYFVYDKRKKEFSSVKNAGSSINTCGNEMTPFYSLNKMTLYFSTDGHPGLGGLDIFKSTGAKRKWSQPVNIGYPINSNSDDLYFSLIPDKNKGFIVSNRLGSISYENYNCCDDIYSFNWLEYASLNIFGGINIQTNTSDTVVLNNNSVELYDFMSDENIEEALSTLSLDEEYFEDDHSRVDSLRLVKDLVIVDLLIYSKGIDAIKDQVIEMLTTSHPDIKTIHWKEYITKRKEQLLSIPETNITYFDYLSEDFLSSTAFHNPVLSHSDSLILMSELYSVDMLIRDNSLILLYESYLKIKEIIPELSEEQWKEYLKNRRQKVEIKYNRDQINRDLYSGELMEIKPDYKKTFISLYYIDPITSEAILIRKDSVWPDGLFKLEADPGKNYKLVAEAPGFLRKSYDFSTRNTNWSDSLNLDIQLIPINDKPIVLENVYFDFDSSVLNPEAKECLDTTLYKVLIDNPEISIEFSAHTDSKGSAEYNKKLSQSRAESVIKYIVLKGINSDRILAKGYGESIPVAPNTNQDGSDNPDGRKKNRRVEFKIIKFSEDIKP